MHFKEAVRLDPSLLNARLYLATAYAQQYVPGGDSDDNKKIAQDAIDAFQDVLRVDPSNTSALASIATIYYNQKKFEEAKDYQQRWIKLEPNDPVPYYWIGVLDWAVCFPAAQTLRVEHNIEQPNKDGQLPVIPEKLRTAIDLKPNDPDTMAYLNLMYRQRAEIDSDDDTRQADLKQAEDWVDKSVAARKAEANMPSSPSPAQ
jgi:tetratricopeptide (TPR) repeat protein